MYVPTSWYQNKSPPRGTYTHDDINHAVLGLPPAQNSFWDTHRTILNSPSTTTLSSVVVIGLMGDCYQRVYCHWPWSTVYTGSSLSLAAGCLLVPLPPVHGPYRQPPYGYNEWQRVSNKIYVQLCMCIGLYVDSGHSWRRLTTARQQCRTTTLSFLSVCLSLWRRRRRFRIDTEVRCVGAHPPF